MLEREVRKMLERRVRKMLERRIRKGQKDGLEKTRKTDYKMLERQGENARKANYKEKLGNCQ